MKNRLGNFNMLVFFFYLIGFLQGGWFYQEALAGGVNYEYVEPKAGFLPPDPPFSIDPEYSGKALGEKCNPIHPSKKCNPGLECLEERVVLNGTSQAIEKWNDGQKNCHFLRECQSGDQSPKQKCFSDCNPDHENCNAKCGNKMGLCTYKAPCLFSYFIPRPENQPSVMGCVDHQECASGYCFPIENMPANLKAQAGGNPKICIPFSKCAKPCKAIGETAGAGDVCCMGLEKKSDGKCFIVGEEAPALPDSLGFEVAQGCQASMFELIDGEKVGNPTPPVESEGDLIPYDYTLVARKFWSFERDILALEWLWKMADSDGVHDYFGIHGKAQEVGKKLAELRAAADNQYSNELIKLKEIEKERLAKTPDKSLGISEQIAKMANSSAGVEFIRLMADEHLSMARISEIKMNMYMDITEPLALLLTKIKEPQSIEPRKYDYEKYGEHDGIIYCKAWLPHCWFSKNICGTYFQKNKVCVKELWYSEGVASGGRDKLLDPIYPKSILTASSFNGSSDWQKFTKIMKRYQEKVTDSVMRGLQSTFNVAYAGDPNKDTEDAAGIWTAVAVATFPYGAAVAAVVGVFDIFTNLNYEIPVKRSDFKNNRGLLVSRIRTHFGAYADQILVSSDPTIQQFNNEKRVHNINSFVNKHELSVKLLIPLQGEEKKAMRKTIMEMTDQSLRSMALDLLSESAANQIVRYSGATGKEYRTDGAGIIENDIQVKLQYLAMYHAVARPMHQQVAACLQAFATKLEERMQGGVHVSDGKPSIQAPVGNSIPNAMTPAGGTGPGGCSGSGCQGSGQAINFGPHQFGNIGDLGGMGMTGFGGNSGSNGTGGKNSNFASGVIGEGGIGSQSLNASRNKRLNARAAILARNKGKGKSSPSSSDLLRQNEGTHGSSKLASLMMKYGHNNALLAALSKQSASDLAAGNGHSGATSEDKNNDDAARLARLKASWGQGGGDGGQQGNSSSSSLKLFGSDSSGGQREWNQGDANSNKTGMKDEEIDALMKESKKQEKVDPETDTLFRQISRAYMKYGVPKLLKKKVAP